jgi:hypothetical protein
MLNGEATHTNFIILGLTLSGLESKIYRTRGEHPNHYTMIGSTLTITPHEGSTLTITPREGSTLTITPRKGSTLTITPQMPINCKILVRLSTIVLFSTFDIDLNRLKLK